MDISVVTGTYNRLHYLQDFVASVRQSIQHPLTYEIVLVDGGSEDGTQSWCRAQSDVFLIEQGELRGAVKAFNAGFAASQGEYCIAGNDDIVVLDRSITRAWVYMEEHPEVGQGCFAQKRDKRQDWHVDVMMAMDGGRQIGVPYGQVAMVPRWLGDEVGWWGNVTRTYGGDNELSANIWEAGYEVVEVPGARIIDQMADDDLRSINRGDPRTAYLSGGNHPDSELWYAKWGRGPTIGADLHWGLRSLGDLRILYVPIIEPDYPIIWDMKRGLREALGGIGRVVEYNYQLRARDVGKESMQAELIDLARDWAPHVILLQVHSCELLDASMVFELRIAVPGTQVLNWNGDYRPGYIGDVDYREFLVGLDVACVVAADAIPMVAELGASAAYWQIGWEPDGVGHEPNGQTPSYDVLFLANCYTDERKALGQALRDLPVEVGIYGWGWPEGWANGENLYDFRVGCRLYRNATVAIGDQQWPEVKGYVSNRLFQAMAAGGAVFCQQRFAGMTEWLGLEDGKHLLTWADEEELQAKVMWALEHPVNAKAIAMAGERYVLEHHSFDARVRELDEIIIDKRGVR